ncbi:DUF6354 family protein [Streptomyces fuscichromogenes]|uniref:Uncharacterized protein n=1 Tax=Streptomyces fuscichromogenes TaxID=1324013 RepID=A0A918CXS4_9ACTN|nr:DUF6354 family protein [Streptomyces fuscichromogenes]GGN46676.1 hypothetical protein GCM10011578_099710 [Streptomyces fuscichromogenes]
MGIPQQRGRTVQEGQLYRDLAPDMIDRDRRLRVTAIEPDGRAVCVVEHDLYNSGQLVGRVTRVHTGNLANQRKFALLEDGPSTTSDPRYTLVLAAVAAVHSPTATPQDYARAALNALGPGDGAA